MKTNLAVAITLAACGSHELSGVDTPPTGEPVDPCENSTITLTVLGSDDLEDAGFWEGSAAMNAGGSTALALGRMRRHVLRVATGAIPAGQIIDFRLNFTVTSARQQTVSEFYLISEANIWTEGTADYAPQAGSVSWNSAGPSPWAGSVGCGTPVADYDPDDAPPSLVVTAPLRWTVHLKPEWLTAWRDGRVNNGVLWVSAPVPDEDASDAFLYSSESTVEPLAVEIDTVTPEGCGA